MLLLLLLLDARRWLGHTRRQPACLTLSLFKVGWRVLLFSGWQIYVAISFGLCLVTRLCGFQLS
jgi:hypothetical protein